MSANNFLQPRIRLSTTAGGSAASATMPGQAYSVVPSALSSSSSSASSSSLSTPAAALGDNWRRPRSSLSVPALPMAPVVSSSSSSGDDTFLEDLAAHSSSSFCSCLKTILTECCPFRRRIQNPSSQSEDQDEAAPSPGSANGTHRNTSGNLHSSDHDKEAESERSQKKPTIHFQMDKTESELASARKSKRKKRLEKKKKDCINKLPCAAYTFQPSMLFTLLIITICQVTVSCALVWYLGFISSESMVESLSLQLRQTTVLATRSEIEQTIGQAFLPTELMAAFTRDRFDQLYQLEQRTDFAFPRSYWEQDPSAWPGYVSGSRAIVTLSQISTVLLAFESVYSVAFVAGPELGALSLSASRNYALYTNSYAQNSNYVDSIQYSWYGTLEEASLAYTNLSAVIANPPPPPPANATTADLQLLSYYLDSDSLESNESSDISTTDTRATLYSRITLLKTNQTYSPLTRPWYQTAVAAGGETVWTQPFQFLNQDQTGISAVKAVYSSKNSSKLIAVLNTVMSIKVVEDFLQTLPLRENGVSFLIDTETGALIATTSPTSRPLALQNYTLNYSMPESQNGPEYTDPFLSEVGRTLLNYGFLPPIDTMDSVLAHDYAEAKYFNFTQSPFVPHISLDDAYFENSVSIEGSTYYLSVSPLNLPKLRWVLVVCTLQSSFDGGLVANTRTTAIYSFVILVGCVVLTVFFTIFITRPLIRIIGLMQAVGMVIKRSMTHNPTVASGLPAGYLRKDTSHGGQTSLQKELRSLEFAARLISPFSETYSTQSDFSESSREHSISHSSSSVNKKKVTQPVLAVTVEEPKAPHAQLQSQAQPHSHAEIELHVKSATEKVDDVNKMDKIEEIDDAANVVVPDETKTSNGADDRRFACAPLSSHCPPGGLSFFSLRSHIYEVTQVSHSLTSLLDALRNILTHLEKASTAKGYFLRYIMHEVRVPFNSITVGVDQMKDGLMKMKRTQKREERKWRALLTRFVRLCQHQPIPAQSPALRISAETGDREGNALTLQSFAIGSSLTPNHLDLDRSQEELTGDLPSPRTKSRLHESYSEMANNADAIQSNSPKQQPYALSAADSATAEETAAVSDLYRQLSRMYSSEALSHTEDLLDLASILEEQGQVVARILNDTLSLQKIEDGGITLRLQPFSMELLTITTLRSFASEFHAKKLQLRCHLLSADGKENVLNREQILGSAPSVSHGTLTDKGKEKEKERDRERDREKDRKDDEKQADKANDKQHEANTFNVEPSERALASIHTAQDLLATTQSPAPMPSPPLTQADEAAGDGNTSSPAVRQLRVGPSCIAEDINGSTDEDVAEWRAANGLPQSFNELLCRCLTCLVLSDAYRLRQVMSNLISNAIKHTPDKGHIVVTLRAKVPEEKQFKSHLFTELPPLINTASTATVGRMSVYRPPGTNAAAANAPVNVLSSPPTLFNSLTVNPHRSSEMLLPNNPNAGGVSGFSSPSSSSAPSSTSAYNLSGSSSVIPPRYVKHGPGGITFKVETDLTYDSTLGNLLSSPYFQAQQSGAILPMPASLQPMVSNSEISSSSSSSIASPASSSSFSSSFFNRNGPSHLHYQFAIEDTGSGIPLEEQAELFTPYKKIRMQEKVKGSGLGLSIAKRLIECLAGSIGVQSNPDKKKGSIFYFNVPLQFFPTQFNQTTTTASAGVNNANTQLNQTDENTHALTKDKNEEHQRHERHDHTDDNYGGTAIPGGSSQRASLAKDTHTEFAPKDLHVQSLALHKGAMGKLGALADSSSATPPVQTTARSSGPSSSFSSFSTTTSAVPSSFSLNTAYAIHTHTAFGTNASDDDNKSLTATARSIQALPTTRTNAHSSNHTNTANISNSLPEPLLLNFGTTTDTKNSSSMATIPTVDETSASEPTSRRPSRSLVVFHPSDPDELPANVPTVRHADSAETTTHLSVSTALVPVPVSSDGGLLAGSARASIPALHAPATKLFRSESDVPAPLSACLPHGTHADPNSPTYVDPALLIASTTGDKLRRLQNSVNNPRRGIDSASSSLSTLNSSKGALQVMSVDSNDAHILTVPTTPTSASTHHSAPSPNAQRMRAYRSSSVFALSSAPISMSSTNIIGGSTSGILSLSSSSSASSNSFNVAVGKLRILVVEDQYASRKLLVSMLRSLGHYPEGVEDGEKAFLLIRNAYEKHLMAAKNAAQAQLAYMNSSAASQSHVKTNAGDGDKTSDTPDSDSTGDRSAIASTVGTHHSSNQGSTASSSSSFPHITFMSRSVSLPMSAMPSTALSAASSASSLSPTPTPACSALSLPDSSSPSQPPSSSSSSSPSTSSTGNSSLSSSSASSSSSRSLFDLLPIWPYDIILMDGNMPVMDGLTAARAIRSIPCHLPIIGVTGNALEEDQKAFLAAGANEIVTKPIQKNELIRVLQHYAKINRIQQQQQQQQQQQHANSKLTHTQTLTAAKESVVRNSNK